MFGARYRVALVILAFVVSASVGAGIADSTGIRSANLQTEPESEEPTLRIEPPSENVTERNATTFLVYLGNPPWNIRPKYVVLRIWTPEDDGLGLTVNGEPPDVSFDRGSGWEFHHDLEPGRHVIYTATVGRNSLPGNHSIVAAGTYVANGSLTTETVQASVSIESVDGPSPSLGESILRTIIGAVYGLAGWIEGHPERAVSILLTAFGVLVASFQLLIALFGAEQFLAGLRWPVRRVRRDHHSDEEERDTPE